MESDPKLPEQFTNAVDNILAFRPRSAGKPMPDAEFEIVSSPRRGFAIRINVRFTADGKPQMIAHDVTAGDAARMVAAIHDLLAGRS